MILVEHQYQAFIHIALGGIWYSLHLIDVIAVNIMGPTHEPCGKLH